MLNNDVLYTMFHQAEQIPITRTHTRAVAEVWGPFSCSGSDKTDMSVSYCRYRQVCILMSRGSVGAASGSDSLTAQLTPSPRDRLLDTAGALFQRYGFRAVGIDRILAASGVAKMTMYRYFASKDEMIAAYLEQADAQFWSWANAAMESAPTPAAKLLTLFEAAGELASSPECLGCVFQGAAMAFPDIEHPAHQRAVRHKRGVRTRLTALAKRAKLSHPDAVGAQLALLLDGAWIAARTFRHTENPARTVTQAAQALIEAHASTRSRRASQKRR